MPILFPPGSSGGGGSALTVKDEGVTLDNAVTSFDFVGAGVTATNVGHAVTVTVPSDAPTNASYITGVAEAGLSAELVLGTKVILAPDTLSNRPGAGTVPAGALYNATDTGLIYRSDGSSTWTTITIASSADRLGLTPTAVKTANYNPAVVGDFVPCDISAGGFTVTLPTAPADGSVIGVKIVKTAAGKVLTIALGGSDVFNIASGATSATLQRNGACMLMQYKASSAIWYVVATDMPRSVAVSATQNTTYSAVSSDDVILITATSAGWTLSLPAASGVTGRIWTFKRTDSNPGNAITIDPNSSETIDGATTVVITTQYAALSIVSDGSNWHII